MKKLTNKKGFTLMEMIIVVAIIAILAVITIPTLTGNTTKAAAAADAANLRAAKAAYQVQKMEGETIVEGAIYDGATGKFKVGTDATTVAATDKIGQCATHKPASGDAAHIYFNGTDVVWSITGTCPQN